MATEESVQYVLATCLEHPNEELFSYCSTCDQRICEICVKGKHKDHEWTLNRNQARKVRLEGKEISDKIRKEIVPSSLSSKGKERREAQKKKVLGMQRRMTDFISSYTQQLLSQIDGQSSSDNGDDLYTGHLLKFADFFERNVHTASDNVAVEMYEKFQESMKEHTQSMAQISIEMVFKEGRMDEEAIKQMFGNLVVNQAKLMVTPMYTFTFGTENIVSLVATSSERVWIYTYRSTKCTLVDKEGKSVHQDDFGEKYKDFIMRDNVHIFVAVGSKAIFRYANGKSQSICSTSPLHPVGICESRDGGMLITLADCAYTAINSKTKGEVHLIDITGKIKKKYITEYTEKTNLFTYPRRIAENNNSDICVIDILNKDLSRRVIGVTVDSKLRFTYKGHERFGKKFSVTDIVCDSAGRIILSDFYNDAIHVLSADGDFLQFLQTVDDRLSGPHSLALYKDMLWIGCHNGVVESYKLQSFLV